jgi:hypothetical protein
LLCQLSFHYSQHMGSVGNTMLHEPLVTDDAGSTDFA